MSLFGEPITYDLEQLESDPTVIIKLLKVTASERGNWMTVGGQYRRNGNPAAALAVVTEMVEGEHHDYCDSFHYSMIYYPNDQC